MLDAYVSPPDSNRDPYSFHMPNIQYKKNVGHKSKIDNVVKIVVKNATNNNSKIIFCSFRKEMDILYEELDAYGIDVKIYGGRSSRKTRQEILANMPNVLILQIQMGCEGLNLQYANEIYFVGPLWNPAMEEQAIGRCYRLGQTKPTHVYKFIMSDVVV
jgi:SNF2 family DNA or RNA helicase